MAANTMWNEKHPDSVAHLLEQLRNVRTEKPKAVRSTVHIYPASIYDPEDSGNHAGPSRDRRITSWKMTEHMYFNANNPFPTMARGLFTEELVEGEEMPPGVDLTGASDRIVARGYDKFFNIDEVAWTNWDAMRIHTEPPYHLTLKSNGCLILISALDAKHLLVASKHSLGTTTESEEPPKEVNGDATAGEMQDLSPDEGKSKNKKKGKQPEVPEPTEQQEAKVHAEEGRKWLRRTLHKSGQTEQDLAKRLWEGNLTAVLELCDDSFEEHVIATPAHWTGLHLHGLNHNTPHFSTASPQEVTSFAQQFGFIPTKSISLQDLDEVKSFTDDLSKTGSWEGEMIEGFVVRSTVKAADSMKMNGKPPYRVGSPFFFKIKFDEPYLLYRQWREVTRVMLPLLEDPGPQKEAEIAKKVRNKVKRPEVEVYADWVGRMMNIEPGLFEDYDRGIVRVRERFLAWTEGDGKADWEAAKAGKYRKNQQKQAPVEVDRENLPKKWILVPVAVPGCGKTLVGAALANLFDFGHTQSDDVTTKKTAPTFLRNIAALLEKKDVVYADRNNHLEQHYTQLANIANEKSMKKYNIRLIALIWDVESMPYHRALRICSERVIKRGDNHQTLRPDLTIEAEHEAVVGQFLRNLITPDPELFDQIITIPLLEAPEEALKRIIDGICTPLGLVIPSGNDICEAIAAAEQKRVTTPYHPPSKVSKTVRYFGLAPEIDLKEVVGGITSRLPINTYCEEHGTAQSFFEGLVESNRITAKPHVTLCHEKTVQEEKDAQVENDVIIVGPHTRLWDTCKHLAEGSTSYMFEYNMTHLVWDERVMALILDKIVPRSQEGDGAVELDLPEDVKMGIHITVGTRTEEISAYESRAITRIARERIALGEEEGSADSVVEGGGKVRWVKIGPLKGEGRVKGMW